MKAENSKSKKKSHLGNLSISVSELLRAMLSKWYLFVICLAIMVGRTLYKTARIEPIYTRSTQILIKSSKKGNSIDEQMETFANMGFRSSTNAYNEIYVFRAPETTIETARRLKLNVEYSKNGKYHPITLYGRTVPVFVEFCDINEDERAGFSIEVNPDSTFTLSNFNGKTIANQRTVKGKLTSAAQTFVATPVGTVALSYNAAYTIRKQEAYTVRRIGLGEAAGKYIGKLNYNLDDEDKNRITITINDNSIERADDILRTVVEVYNENWIKDKNKAARETKKFIETRLGYVSDELDKIESNVSAFKSNNLLPDLESQSERQLTRERELEKQRSNIQKELEKSEFFLKTIKKDSKKHLLLPWNPGINNANISAQISEFNSTMLERNSLASKSSEDNPAVKDMDLVLSSMRSALISSVNTHIKSCKTKSESINKEWKTLQSEIAKNPKHTTFLASAEREQSVKENIYLFLLQKREENQLSQEFTASKIRILAPPSGSYEPTAPKKTRSLIFSILIGLAIPAILVCIIEVSNTRIRGRKDLDCLTTPVIGEIPQNDKKRARRLRRLLSRFKFFSKKKDYKSARVVKEGSRNAINEAFRVLRTNIEFITRDNGQNVIIFTSFNPGSGKTFCILNTAISFALRGEKILLIDGDMRHASLSEHASSNEIGLSNYLAKEAHSLEEIIVADETHPNLHIIPTGTIPPNPTELLESGRLQQLIEEANNKEYKYIFIDCPPIDIVADTHIIEQYATNSLFLVRCGLLQRSMLGEIENLYTENKLKRMSVILNGIDMKAGKYGYKYGYNDGGKYSYGPKKKKKK